VIGGSAGVLFEAGEEVVVDRGSFGLLVVFGVVGLGAQGRFELDGGLVVNRTGFDGGSV
jgi:hypothetical protein